MVLDTSKTGESTKLIVEFDGPPSWSLDTRKNWGEYKIPVGRGGGVTNRYFVLSPVLLASRDQTKMAVGKTQQPTSMIS